MGDLSPWLSDHTIRVLTMIGGWLAGLGSLAAVVTSLWLAGRSQKLRLHVKVGWRASAKGLGGPPELRRARFHIIVSVTNASLRAVMVQRVEWVHRNRMGRIRGGLSLPPGEPLDRVGANADTRDSRLPRKLEPGEDCELWFDWAGSLVPFINSSKFGGAIVYTPLGNKIVPRKEVQRGRMAPVDPA